MTELLNNFKTRAMPSIATAIKAAENDPTGNFGIRSIEDVSNPSQILSNSIMNNFNRWQGGKTPAPWINERPEKFVDFMQRRWAPIGAENDPNNLNQNWAPNVRSILQRILGEEEYNKWKALNIVKAQSQGATYA